jgi:hypothetical protein
MDYDSDADDPVESDGNDLSVMTKYLRAILRQLKAECNTKPPLLLDTHCWLRQYLEQNQFWIRKQSVKFICGKLGIDMDLEGYYRDVRVWLPDEQYGLWPTCPSCHANSSIGVHGYSHKTIARRVIGLKNHYFILSRRYICHDCEKCDTEPRPKYTFRAYNEESVKRLPRQKGIDFPAMLTHKLAIDKDLIDMMRPLFDGGIRPERFQRMIAELHHKEFHRLALLHECSDEGKVFRTELEKQMFSTYHDKLKYSGYVSNAKWFRRCYSKFMKTIRLLQNNEMKKRGMDIMKLDACYKPCKKLKRLNRQKIVNCIITAKNGCNEERTQFMAPTDAQDQYVAPLERMTQTLQELGQKQPRLAYVDNPCSSLWLLEVQPSLAKTQEKYDTLVADNGESNIGPGDNTSDAKYYYYYYYYYTQC